MSVCGMLYSVRELSVVVVLPRSIVERARSLGVDLEAAVLEAVAERLGMDPREEAGVHVELAERFFREGVEVLERDPVQASEKLYKVAEECVKALAKHLRLEEVLSRVKARGRWTVTDLERVVGEVAGKIDERFITWWDSANYLHVWGFHEAKLDVKSVKMRMPHVESMLRRTKEVLGV